MSWLYYVFPRLVSGLCQPSLSARDLFPGQKITLFKTKHKSNNCPLFLSTPLISWPYMHLYLLVSRPTKSTKPQSNQTNPTSFLDAFMPTCDWIYVAFPHLPISINVHPTHRLLHTNPSLLNCSSRGKKRKTIHPFNPMTNSKRMIRSWHQSITTLLILLDS